MVAVLANDIFRDPPKSISTVATCNCYAYVIPRLEGPRSLCALQEPRRRRCVRSEQRDAMPFRHSENKKAHQLKG